MKEDKFPSPRETFDEMSTTYGDITLALLNARKRRGGQNASSAKAALKATLKQ